MLYENAHPLEPADTEHAAIRKYGHGRIPLSPAPMVKGLRLIAAVLGSLFVVAFQLQLLPFFSPVFINDRLFWPIIYYGCCSLVIGLTLIILATQKSILHRSLPVLLVCAVAASLVLLHPIDNISKNFLVATVFVACAFVLAIASAPFALLRFSASVTVLSAVTCLLDILFAHGFTNTAGRAAGLGINANVAAAGLLLGAASSYWAVPQRWRGPFLLIVGAAIFVTLSRSSILAAIAIYSCGVAYAIWTRVKSPGPRPRLGWFRSGVLAIGLAGWIVAALFSNDRFFVATTNAYQQIGSAPAKFEEARRSGRRPETVGDINSISARGLLMERASSSYQSGPLFGQGLAAGYALQPHNTFLLFATAFGHLGWFVPIAFLGLTVYWARWIQQLPLFFATLTVMATSHDIALTPSLLAPIVLGMAGMNSTQYLASDMPHAFSAIRYPAVVAPIAFALGTVWIAGTELLSAQAPPGPLLFLVFCAIASWSAAVWRWHAKPTYPQEGQGTRSLEGRIATIDHGQMESRTFRPAPSPNAP
jgi:hypothetical protein